MRILLLTTPAEDYLADSLLLGLRARLGADVVDAPRADRLYADALPETRARIRGNGFTLYTGLLAPDTIDRSHLLRRIQLREFDAVVVSYIWRQWGELLQGWDILRQSPLVYLDGEDSPQIYPSAGRWWRRPYGWFVPKPTSSTPYFKREWTEESRHGLVPRFLPRPFKRWVPAPGHLRRIGFSIPPEKVVPAVPVKRKDFPVHIVDPEVAAAVPGAKTSYAFADEAAYYGDLQASRFGITTKRAGWDCLRHYEIAAQGTVPCFRDFHLKPETCAPHGLIPGANCLAYRTWPELQAQIQALGDVAYRRLAEGALAWARDHTTVAEADRFLAALRAR